MSSSIVTNNYDGTLEIVQIEKQKDGSLYIRVDDSDNAEIWFEITITNKRMKEISKIKK
jgi:hypothetical protein